MAGIVGAATLQVTAFPLVGEGEQMLGVMNIFWEI
jgi:hypothetical protein